MSIKEADEKLLYELYSYYQTKFSKGTNIKYKTVEQLKAKYNIKQVIKH
jgi:hypothetical protein